MIFSIYFQKISFRSQHDRFIPPALGSIEAVSYQQVSAGFLSQISQFRRKLNLGIKSKSQLRHHYQLRPLPRCCPSLVTQGTQPLSLGFA